MVYSSNDPFRSGRGGFSNPVSGPAPPDLVVLLATVFITFSLQFFASTAVVPALLRLTPAVWRSGFVWQLVTYPFAGFGGPSLWFLLELLIVYMFGKSVLERLGRRRFWRLLAGVSLAAATVAVAAGIVGGGGAAEPQPFVLMQGQRMLLTVLIAAFATLYSTATIQLFFVLPIRAGWFLGLEILFAFLGFLGTRDLPGFLGICAAVGTTWLWLTPGSASDELKRLWLRVRAEWLKYRLAWLRKRRGIHLVPDKDRKPRDPWMH